MSLGLCFWIIMLVTAVFGLWSGWPFSGANVRTSGMGVLTYVLIFLLGWHAFGAPLHN